MRFYDRQHQFYCGVDLHTKRMYLCILDQDGNKRLHRNVRAKPLDFLSAVKDFRDDLVVGVECMFTWYWLADLCQDEGIEFLLGHALYMRAIHGGKKKDDKLDSEKIARLIRGGTFPLSYVYPREMRAARDLVRRRMFLVRRRSELLQHVQLVNQQYNYEAFEKTLKYPGNRDVLDRFEEDSARMTVEADLLMVGHYDRLLKQLEANLLRQAIRHDPQSCSLLRTIPGIGKILSLVLLYEIHTIDRFPSVGDFLSYARLVTPKQTSAGKVTGQGGAKIGNSHLKWAFSEAVLWMLRYCDEAKAFLKRKEKKHGKSRAMTMLSRKIARAVFYILKRKEPFDAVAFFAS
ncbi:IS110 family transposase [Aeoliella sp. ICT_H6.2]|uniref:IS110 family transposase n=1 Tax=Aeoliella straminimaris TaxID=2954799 RepID=A0A9X2JJ62_9BACT|nr:IS110 family transposase [Aeoliella straminimaris]MCO6044654.1 IS110 family transposase [Aeoliella straminimaris]